MADIGSTFLDQLEAGAGLGSRYQALLEAIASRELLPVRVQQICRHRIAELHGIESGKVEITPESEAELAALQLADKMPYQHHAITDEDVEVARRHFGNSGSVALLTYLAFCDVNCRISLTMSAGDH